MTEEKADPQPVVRSLKSAIRRARLEAAERSDVLAELRGAEMARLEMLAEALEPLYAQLPDDIDIFDAGVVPGERPRLFVDMIGFVELANDKRTYRFVQDTRHGRVIIRQSDRADTMVGAITDYISQRLLERERALASDQTIETAARNLAASQTRAANASDPAPIASSATGEPASKPAAAAASRDFLDAASEQQDSAQDPAKGSKVRENLRAVQAGSGKASKTAPAGTLAGSAAKPARGALAWVWDAIEFLALFFGFTVLLTAVAGALYFFWSVGDWGLITKFFKQAG
ncbi:MAG: hypothetical protein NWT00_05525 [Beijerinckiaceae bacterium]|jgi:hypothetical protein|nr:hypothetical protein [Beijerinckiaceae bacterium]